MENGKEELLEIVEREYGEFRESTLCKTKAEIFDDCYTINFYNEVRNYLNDSELDDDTCETLIKESKNGLFEGLWNRFLKWEYSSVGSYSDTEEFISEYCDYVRENQEAM